jgi:hypothetical protein
MSESKRYEDVETLRDEDGVIAVITRRVETGHLSFRIQKEFEAQGQVKVTAYLGRRHLPAIVRLAARVADRIDILVDQSRLDRTRT